MRKQLKDIDSLLDIRWMPNAIWNESAKTMEGRYCLANDWPQGDPRWQLYQTGEIQEHFDMIGWFCEDIHSADSIPVDIDSIELKVIELLGKCDNSRQSWRDRMKDMVEKNAKLRKNRKQELTDKAQNAAEVLFHAVGRHEEPRVRRIMQEISQGVGE